MNIYQQIESNKRRSVLLVILFIVFIIALGYTFAYINDSPGLLLLAIPISIIMSLTSYYSGDKIALWSSGAQGPIKKEANPYVYRLVENLCITAGLPMPKIYLINDSAPNAFATGRDPQHASIAMTTGIIQLLENEELEGVIAHELSHIKNYDIRLMMIVIICVGIVSLLANWFLRFSFFGRGGRRDKNGAGLIFMLIGVILMILSPLIAKLIQLAVSRKREFLADASAVLLTRYPAGLAKALEKISAAAQPLQRTNPATAHLFIASPFGATKHSWRNLFSTHPPISERVKALRSIA
ncbi:MAG: M48 family metallopeptidase [Patescibacteria group bacterium]|jgi:heat shock protein HtpX